MRVRKSWDCRVLGSPYICMNFNSRNLTSFFPSVKSQAKGPCGYGKGGPNKHCEIFQTAFCNKDLLSRALSHLEEGHSSPSSFHLI